jgi:predicted amidohydrolase YtcJ
MSNHATSMLLKNGRIYRSAFDMQPASAVLVDGDRIAWVGETYDAPAAGRVIDLQGASVLPGLTDAHIHLFAIAQGRLQVLLAPPSVTDLSDVLCLLSERGRTQPPGSWVFAAGLDENALAERRFPLREELDRILPEHPLLIRRFCGHAAVLNSAALQALELQDGLSDPEGGAFGRTPDGRLDGCAMEKAAEIVFRTIPPFDRKDVAAALRAVIDECARMGLTAAVEAAVGFTNGFDDEDGVWNLLRRDGSLPIRLGFMLQLDPEDAVGKGLSPRLDRDWQLATLKFFADGIVGARTAAVSEGYVDTPSQGFFVRPPEELDRAIVAAHRAGWQVAVHAIGDLAIGHVISSFEQAQQLSPRDDARHRIEHFFCPPRGGFERMRKLDALIVMQPSFLQRMNASIRTAFGPRADRYYPGRSVVDAGVTYVCSSDAPTGLWSPWAGMADAIDRAQRHGHAIGPQEALSTRQALASYIAGGAHAMKQETWRGRLEAGMAADLIVIDRDPIACSPADLAGTRTMMTVTRGEAVHDQMTMSAKEIAL